MAVAPSALALVISDRQSREKWNGGGRRPPPLVKAVRRFYFSRTASFKPPTVFCTLPLAWSENMLPIAETLVRIVVGVMFLMHVSRKLTAGPGAVAANMLAKNGLEPSMLWAYVIIFLELVGGICLIIGLFTRFFAAALVIEMLVALLVVHLPRGYAASGGGYEYVLLIGA